MIQRITAFSAMILMIATFPSARAGGDPPPGRQVAFGLVIGNNASDDPEKSPLHYADDDAVQNARLLLELGGAGAVILLTRLDTESKALYPDLSAGEPLRRAVVAALDRLNQLMEVALQEGNTPILYIFYSGHGDVDNNQGYIHLEDGRFTRDDLLELLRRSRAEVNHVIIDACKSYFMVFPRGTGGERRPVAGPLIGEEDSLPSNTGVFLSTSSATDSHEWEAFSGGVFSHEVRSALRGAADLDQDGAVTYEEAAAFVWTANSAIPNQRFRPAVYVRSPSEGGQARDVLMDFGRLTGDRLLVGPGQPGHFFIEDEQGLRIADLHPGRDRRLLWLPTRRPLYLRRTGSDEEVSLPPGKELQLSQLETHPVSVRRRGAEHVAFHKLFSRPFDQSALQTYRNRTVAEVEVSEARPDYTWVRRGLGIAAVTFGAVGATMTGLAAREFNKADEQTDGLRREEINGRIDQYNITAVTMYALAGAAFATYLVWTLWPEEEVEIQLLPSAEPQLQMTVRFW